MAVALSESWEKACWHWEEVTKSELSPQSLVRYRAPARSFAHFCTDFAAVPADVTLDLVRQYEKQLQTKNVSKSYLALSMAAARSFHRSLETSSPTPTPKQEPAPMPHAFAEPIEVSDEISEEAVAAAEAEAAAEEVPAPQAPSVEARQVAKAEVDAVLRERLAKANRIKAEKKAARDAAKAAAAGMAAGGVIARTVQTEAKLPSNRKMTLYKRDETGSRNFCTTYSTDDFKGQSSAEAFVAAYAVPKWGAGKYELVVLDANDQPLTTHQINILAPSGDTANPHDPMTLVKEILNLSQTIGPGAQAQKQKLMQTLLGAGSGEQPMSRTEMMMLLQQFAPAAPAMDVEKIISLVTNLGKREPNSSPVAPMPLPPSGPDPTMMMIMESMKQSNQMMLTLFTTMMGNRPTGPDPVMTEVLKAERERANRLEDRLDKLQNQPPLGLRDALTELREAQDVVKGIPGFESVSGEATGLGGLLSKLVENGPAVSKIIGDVAERIAQSKAGAVRTALASGPQQLPAPQPQQRPVTPLPAAARIAIVQLAKAEKDEEITEAVINTLVALANDPVWAEKLRPYQEGLRAGDDNMVRELISQLFRFAHIPEKATPERIEKILSGLKQIAGPVADAHDEAAAEAEDADDDEEDEEIEDEPIEALAAKGVQHLAQPEPGDVIATQEIRVVENGRASPTR